MPQPTLQDRNRVIEFIRETYALIGELIAEEGNHRGHRVLPEVLLPSFRAAWQKFNEQFPVDRAEATIRQTPDDRFFRAGLYGAQLSLKLSMIARCRSRYFSLGGARLLKKLLDAIDRLLDSLIAATGIDEALKELKDILRDNVGEEA